MNQGFQLFIGRIIRGPIVIIKMVNGHGAYLGVGVRGQNRFYQFWTFFLYPVDVTTYPPTAQAVGGMRSQELVGLFRRTRQPVLASWLSKGR